MEFSEQAMIHAWIHATVGRHEVRTGQVTGATIDAVRGAGPAPLIVNWRLRVARVGGFAAQAAPGRQDTHATIDAHDPARTPRRHVTAGGHDLGATREGPAAL